MPKRDRIECEEADRLRAESTRLYVEWDAIRGEVNQATKTDPGYAELVEQLKRASSRSHHAGELWDHHIRDHKCRG